MKIKVISFDIFQTLVDVNRRVPQIWKGILGDAYTPEDGVRGSQAILDYYPRSLHKALASDKFFTMQEVYIDCARSALEKIKLPVSPETIVENLLIQHSKAPLYDDVVPCLEKLHGKYKIILSSDSNRMMVDDLLKYFICDEIFISDDLGCYKEGPDGRFFRRITDRMGVKPGEILHIGDSVSDVLGAGRAGVASCWLNRTKALWRHEIRPDYSIEGLDELALMLDLLE